VVPLECKTDWNPDSVVKGKAVPVHAWTGREDPGSLRLLDFETFGT